MKQVLNILAAFPLLATAQKVKLAFNAAPERAAVRTVHRPVAPAGNAAAAKIAKRHPAAASPLKLVKAPAVKASPAAARRRPATPDRFVMAVKGQLAYPFPNYTVSQHFGITDMGTYRLFNPGITFSSPAPVTARACHAAVVEAVVLIEDSYAVITSFGTVLLGYSNLEEVFVKKGDSLTAGTPLGTLGMDERGSYSLLVLLQAGTTETDPRHWFMQAGRGRLSDAGE